MRSAEGRFLLLTGKLGDPERNPLTTAQLRLLARRIPMLKIDGQDSELTLRHLTSVGLDVNLSRKILHLLGDELQLQAYLTNAKKYDCVPIFRDQQTYPRILRNRLGPDAPGCLWSKGNRDILNMSAVSLVGSREILPANRRFAEEVGIQAAMQGFALVSGNARGSDLAAQEACLAAGGSVIVVVADALMNHPLRKNVLYLSEEDYDIPFSSYRALHRNYVIHCLGELVFVAQCTLKNGGTWNGVTANLKKQWSPVFCFRDRSESSLELEKQGAELIDCGKLRDFSELSQYQQSFFE